MERAGDIISVERHGNALALVQRDLHEHVSAAHAIRVRRQRLNVENACGSARNAKCRA